MLGKREIKRFLNINVIKYRGVIKQGNGCRGENMFNQELVSVIVPVYNCEKYIGECLDTISGQTYRNIEIIVIDDGSSDASTEIVRNKKIKDKRIKLIIKKNAGVSASRNLGIECSKGKFLVFIDADDWIEEQYIENLVDLMEYADLGICGYSRINKNKINKYEIKGEKIRKIEKEEVIYYSICTPYITGACWNKIFKRNLIEEKKIRFEKEVCIGEDTLFFLRYLDICDGCYYTTQSLYNYRKNNDSAIQATYSKRKFEPKKKSVLTALKKIACEVKLAKKAEYKKYFGYRMVRSSLWLMVQMILGKYYDEVTIAEIKHNCKKNIKEWMFERKIGSFTERVAALGVVIIPKSFLKIMCMGNKI